MKITIPLKLRDYIEHQRRNPLSPEILLDSPKRVAPLVKLTWHNRDYLPADRRLGRLADELEVPASMAKGLVRERKVALINPTGSRVLGAWNCLEIGPDQA